MTNVHIQPPICTDRALELSWKDSNIRYLDHLGNSDIAEIVVAPQELDVPAELVCATSVAWRAPAQVTPTLDES